VEHLHRASLSRDVELVPRLPAEGTSLVAPDLTRDGEATEEAERSSSDRRAGQVEVERDLAATSEVDPAGGMKESRKLGEPIAFPPGRDPRELAANFLGKRHAVGNLQSSR
jgi:predicted TIM-barrel fold metal-dependent hydrolase